MNTALVFDKTKHLGKNRHEFRKARELAKVMNYVDYRNFLKVIEKAKKACKNSWYSTDEHFVEINESHKSRNQYWETNGKIVGDVYLSRYACYLIMQNADPSKEVVAKWQTYFATQTRKQEVSQHGSMQWETEKRVYLREEMKVHNKKLAWTAKRAGVTDFADFTDAGYQWLYGWLRQSDIHEKKWLQKEQKILDHMNSEELAANLFRATQTEAKIKREEIKWQEKASRAHHDVGQKVRRTIEDIWGTMPELLPVVEDINLAQKKLKQRLKQK